MLVRDLIGDAVWRPGRDYDRPAPTISVLLPTYRRAAGDRFLRAARSVLTQTLADLELIVTDDGSSDGTADQISRPMETDGRVSCITHRRNVGLPAVSIYEGYLRARAPYLAFAFDDFIFDARALEGLVAAADARGADVVH